MMYELLLALRERLDQIAIVGLGSVAGDFRLKKLEEKLALLSSKAPVLAKLHVLVTKLIAGEERVTTFMELNSLVDAILTTQGISKPEGEAEAITIYEHQGECPLTFMQLQEAKNILGGGTTTKWASLKKAYDEGKLYDFRLLEDLLTHIGDSYEYTDYSLAQGEERKPFSIVTILEQYGKDIIPLLLQRFEGFSGSQKTNAIKLIYRLGGTAYNDFYKKCAEDEETDSTIIEALKALGDTAENEAFLLAFKTKKKKIQEARIMALAKILRFKGERKESAYYWTKEVMDGALMGEVRKYCLKDDELFTTVFREVPFYNEDEFADLLVKKMEEIKKDDKVMSTTLYTNKAYQLVRGILPILDYYDEKTALDVVKKLMALESDKEDLCFEASIGSHVLADYLQCSSHQVCQRYLAELVDQYNGYYLTDSFVAAVKVCEPAYVFETFSPLINKKYPRSNLVIRQILEELAVRDTQIFNTTKWSRSHYYLYHSEEMSVSGSRSVHVQLHNVKWDARWLKTAETMHSSRIMTFFLVKCAKEDERATYKKFYIDELTNWYKELGKEEYVYYMNLDTAKRGEYIDELVCMLTGLCLTGAKEEAVSAIPYFVGHLDQFEETVVNNLCEADLVYIDRLEAGIDQFKENKRKKMEGFIDYARKTLKNRSYNG